MIRYCLPILDDNPEEVLRIIERNRSGYDYFEIWLDYLGSGAYELAREVAFQLGERALFLFRRQGLEQIHMPISERHRIIDLIGESNSYLDLDIAHQEEDLEYVRQGDVRPALITSYHNYERTPGDEEMAHIVERMIDLDGAILKISTFCNSRSDALRLLTLCLELAEAGERFTVLGMGEHGRITRVFGTLWGNQMIFAPQEKSKATAPGQLTRLELEECFKILT